MVFLVLLVGPGFPAVWLASHARKSTGAGPGGTGNYIPKPAAGTLWGFGNVNAMNTTFSAYTRVIPVTGGPSIETPSQPMLIRFV